MLSLSLTAALKERASELGFGPAGVCPAVTPAGLHRFHDWLAAGYAGEMTYLADRADAYAHPEHVLEGVRSVLMLAMPYRTVEPPAGVPPGWGRISRYAWGTDYHDLIRERLGLLATFLRELEPAASVRGVVDTAPLLEREFAELAGVGWIGKNTLLLNKHFGSWFFLAALLTDIELEYDAAHEAHHCGTCRACLDVCPTGALVDAYVLDARKCISYLTIELRSSVPDDLRTGVGDWLFGCDLCQEVCPWNHRAPHVDEPGLMPTAEGGFVELAELFTLTDDEFRRRFRHTPLWRPKRRGILRNAAIVLGNQAGRLEGSERERAMSALERAAADCELLVRGAAVWALGQFNDLQAADVSSPRSTTIAKNSAKLEETAC